MANEPLAAAKQRLRYWRQRCADAGKRADAQRIEECERHIEQLKKDVEALDRRTKPR